MILASAICLGIAVFLIVYWWTIDETDDDETSIDF